MRLLLLLLLGAVAKSAAAGQQQQQQQPLTAEAVLSSMALVNAYFQRVLPGVSSKQHAAGVPNNDWTGGVYMQGNLAHFRASKNSSLLAYAVEWGTQHKWQMAGYEGCHGTSGCPDNILAGASYAEIYQLRGSKPEDSAMISGVRSAVEVALANPCEVATNVTQRKDSDHCWWWVDALFMALPTFARVGQLASPSGGAITPAAPSAAAIWDAARVQYNVTAHGVNATGAKAFGLWSEQDQMFWRDDSYITKKSRNGKGVFWSRGVGWAFGAMARTLELLPASRVSDRVEYTDKLVRMAARLKALQGPDGCWRSSLEDAAQFPQIETSGTSLNVFGLAWGVNHGLLAASDYAAAAKRGWGCLTGHPSPVGAVATDGRLGWCQVRTHALTPPWFRLQSHPISTLHFTFLLPACCC